MTITIILFLFVIQPAYLTESLFLGEYRLDSEKGRFSVTFPEKPTLEGKAVKSPIGTLKLYTYSYYSNYINYAITYSDYPSWFVENSNPSEMLDKSRDGMISSIKGKLLSENVIHYGKFEGREIKAKTANGYIVINRTYLINNRLYQLNVTSISKYISEQKQKAFFESFKIKNTTER